MINGCHVVLNHMTKFYMSAGTKIGFVKKDMASRL